MAASGREDTAGTWLAAYRLPLVGYVLPLVDGDLQAAEDVVQETMIRGWQHEGELHRQRAGSWLHTVARNLAISTYHRRRRARPREVPLDDGLVPAAGDGLDSRIDAWLIAAALNELSAEQRRPRHRARQCCLAPIGYRQPPGGDQGQDLGNYCSTERRRVRDRPLEPAGANAMTGKSAGKSGWIAPRQSEDSQRARRAGGPAGDRARRLGLLAVAALAARLVTAAGLGIDAFVHADLASLYAEGGGAINEGVLFRVEAVLAALIALAVIVTGRRLAFLTALGVSASALALMLVSRYADLGTLGPFPDLYDPVWFREKLWAAFGEGAAAFSALTGVILCGVRRKHEPGR